MTKDDVSLAALEDVYHALKKFQRDVRDIPGNVSRHINSLYSSCEGEIDRAKKEIERLKEKIYSEKREIASLQRDISYYEAEISNRRSEIAGYKSRISDMVRKAPVETERDIRYHDPLEWDRIQKIRIKISSCESTINNCCACQENLCRELWRAEDALRGLERTVRQKEDRLGRMKTAFSDVRSCCMGLAAEVSRFCGGAAEFGGTEASGVAFCIERLEEYINTSI